MRWILFSMIFHIFIISQINQSLFTSLGGDLWRAVYVIFSLEALLFFLGVCYPKCLKYPKAVINTAKIEATMMIDCYQPAMIMPPTAKNLPKPLTTTPNFLWIGLKLIPLNKVVAPPICWTKTTTKNIAPKWQ